MKCYGRTLSTVSIVYQDTVGVVAAQSIGEPYTVNIKNIPLGGTASKIASELV